MAEPRVDVAARMQSGRTGDLMTASRRLVFPSGEEPGTLRDDWHISDGLRVEVVDTSSGHFGACRRIGR